MATCTAKLSSTQRRILRTLLAQESEIADQCNRHITHLLNMMNKLQIMYHDDDPENRELKCNEFIRMHAGDGHVMANYEMVPGAIQTAMNCNCICIQAACFRMVYKWIPKLDALQMKLLKIQTMCEKHGSKTGIELCAEIEKIVQNILKLQTTSH
jgi:hypothetical protein